MTAAHPVTATTPAGSSAGHLIVFGLVLITSGVINMAMPGTP